MAVRRHLVALLALFSLIVGFTVSSTSIAGALPPSPTVPAAPTSLVAYRGNSSAEIAFTAGANGGAAITNYKYQINDGSWTALSPAVTTSSVTIGGLTNGTTYSVKLRAVNSVGDGAISDAVSVTPAVVNTTTWTSRTAAAAVQWYSVAYGNGIFVAVAGSGGSGQRVMTSTDGVSWTGRTAAEQNDWYSVTYGNGLFVAVAWSGTNRVMTSPDGVTWTARSAPASNWVSVTYGNGVFVAVSDWGQVMTSSDGAAWTLQTPAANEQWYSVVYGNDRFVVISRSDAVMTSTDGVIWTSQTATAAQGFASVTFGNGLFVAAGGGGMMEPGPLVMTSPDGVTWTSRTAASQSRWSSVTFGNGLFVAVSSWGGNVMTSPDGMTWTAGTAAEANTWYGVTYGNGVFVAVAYSGTNRVMTSSLTSLATAPVAPTSLVATAGVSSASIAFTPGADGGASITKYQYKVGNGSWTDAVGTTSPITISGLTNFVSASIRLRAVNSVGNGAASSPVSVIPRQAGPAVTSATPSGRTGIVVTFNLNPLPGTTVAYQSVVAYARGTNTVRGTCRTYGRQSTCFIGGLTRATNYDLRATAHLPVPGKAWHNATFEGSILQVSTRS